MKRAAPTEIPVADENDILKITPLGAGNEVGRSCIMVEYKEKKIMLDCGLHPGLQGLAALPFFDEIDPESVDLLLVSHFHIDHAASVPYFMQKTNFKGRVFMTHPTRAIYKWMLSDYVKVSNLASEADMLYTEADLLESFERIEVMDYHQARTPLPFNSLLQEVIVDGIRFTSYNAGHVLGAAMFLIEIAGIKILYTGDYSREEDRHLMAAERPKNVVPEVLICESTYGVQSHQPRIEREALFTGMVHRIVSQGGRCLIPAFALGRAQELLLILDEYWQAHPELHSVPIYYASSLAKKCMTVYQTYTNMMNERIKRQIKISNPFLFKHISNLKSIAHFDDVGPCVMMASPGMLQSGLSRELLELWAPDKRNGVIIPGYVVEGTLGKTILSQPPEIPTMAGGKISLNCSVEYISFSAHVDYQQNSQFIHAVASPHLVLVHGDANEMGRLRGALDDKYADADKPVRIYTPRNCEVVEFYFRGEKMAKTLGSLAQEAPQQDATVHGILVSRDFQYNIIAPGELSEFTRESLCLSTLDARQTVPCRSGMTFSLVKWHLEMMYGSAGVVDMTKDGAKESSIRVYDTVRVSQTEKRDAFVLEWQGNGVNDMIADSVLAIILQAESSPASVKATRSEHQHHHHHQKDGKDGSVKIKIEEVDDGEKDNLDDNGDKVSVDKDDKGNGDKVSVDTDDKGNGDKDKADTDDKEKTDTDGKKKDIRDTTTTTRDTDDEETAMFAFYSTLLLACHYGAERVELLWPPNDGGDLFRRVPRDTVTRMGREYDTVVRELGSAISIDGAEADEGRKGMREQADALVRDRTARGVWAVRLDKGWCLVSVSAGRGGVVVQPGHGVSVREDVVRKLSGIGERIQDALLPIARPDEI